jgi:hypothetical protein
LEDESVRTNRRRLLGAAALTMPFLAIGETRASASMAPATATPEEFQRAEAPAWTFGVYHIEDPYGGIIQAPASPPKGTRYVAAEIDIDNASDQPLAFTPAEVRVRDQEGYEYRGGSAIGTEPSISPRNMNAGERSRGWVWFTVDEKASLVEIAYYGPQPQFRIKIGG